jgi:hypothetical protein
VERGSIFVKGFLRSQSGHFKTACCPNDCRCELWNRKVSRLA